jgi:DNA repair exonuclease SbcCD ATPase subunit
MKLLKLILKDFKGMHEFVLDLQGENAAVYGENGTGKTSLFDAYNWLLFGKDSANKADFQIKTLDEAGEAFHNINHEVEGTFEIQDKTVSLRKVYYEKWTQKRGNVTSEFSGHTTDQYIDGVPVPKKQYEKFISEIVDESIFKLVTSPAYFNEHLSWQDRRSVLLEICGDVSDADVIDSAVTAGNKDMASLLNLLNSGRTLDDYRKVLAARQSVINKDLKEIPSRIDEVKRGLPDISGIKTEVLQGEIDSIKTQQQTKQQEIVRIQNGGQVAEKQKALSEMEGRIIDSKNRFKSEFGDKVHSKKMQLNDLKMKLSAAGNKLESNLQTIEKNQAEMKRCDMSRETLRGKWQKAYENQFAFDQSDICPTCGQPLPVAQIEAARQKALEQFNLAKSNELESINTEGKRHKEKTGALQTANETLQRENESYLLEKQQLEQEINKLQAEIDGVNAPTIESDPEYLKALQDKAEIQEQITALQSESQTVIRSIQSEMDVLNAEIASREKTMACFGQYEKGQKRIKELEGKEKELSAEYEVLQHELYMTEQFIRTKVSMLEEKINSRFQYARFKLFDVQVNGAVNECCEVTFKGVPYSSGLNNAAKINVGLDVINTLSEHYDFSAPIFVDNAESVTQLIPVKGQVVSLVVSKADKALRVECTENTLREAV